MQKKYHKFCKLLLKLTIVSQRGNYFLSYSINNWLFTKFQVFNLRVFRSMWLTLSKGLLSQLWLLIIHYSEVEMFLSVMCIVQCQFINSYPGPRGFLSPWRDETRERKKQWEKTSGCGRCESHYHLIIGVCHKNWLSSNQ